MLWKNGMNKINSYAKMLQAFKVTNDIVKANQEWADRIRKNWARGTK